jgi:hypothetical protein
MKWYVVLLAILSVSGWTAAKEVRTLVLLDSLATRETHSMFFKSLQGKLEEIL